MKGKFLFWFLFIIVGLKSYFNAIGFYWVNYVIFNYVFLFIFIVYLRTSYFATKDKFDVFFYFSLILFFISELRSTIQTNESKLTLGNNLFFLIIIIIFLSPFALNPSDFIKNFFISMLIYIVANYFGRFILGISNIMEQNLFSSVREARVSLIGEKILFPFCSNTRSFASDCGVFGIFCYYYYRKSFHTAARYIFLCLFFVAAISILFTDSRLLFLLLFAVISFNLIIFAKIKFSSVKFTILLWAMFPFLYLLVIFFSINSIGANK